MIEGLLRRGLVKTLAGILAGYAVDIAVAGSVALLGKRWAYVWNIYTLGLSATLQACPGGRPDGKRAGGRGDGPGSKRTIESTEGIRGQAKRTLSTREKGKRRRKTTWTLSYRYLVRSRTDKDEPAQRAPLCSAPARGEKHGCGFLAATQGIQENLMGDLQRGILE